jgi:hypothetical protein
MDTASLLDPDQWAELTFGQTPLRDRRRTRRAVQAAGAMVRDPAASLPQQQHTWKTVKAVYRLLSEPDVTFAALMQPHWQQTRAALESPAVVLLVQDTTELDFSAHPATTGLGQIGNGKGRGILLQTVLAVLPETRTVLGCLAQQSFLRVPAPPREQRYQRRHRAHRETDIWLRMVEQVGPLPAGTGCLVHVGDRGADMLPLFRQCLMTQTHFVIRAAQNRRVLVGAVGPMAPTTTGAEPALAKNPQHSQDTDATAIDHLLDYVRTWPSQAQRPFEVPASHGRRPRQAALHLSFGPVTLLPPWNDPRGSNTPLALWAIRVWETHPPAGEEPLEWILLTSLETQTCAHAWQRVDWYRCRWIVEDYHQCLKTGCRIEVRQLHTAARCIRLLGLLSPMAVRLVQLRDLAQRAPDLAATACVAPSAVALVAAWAAVPPQSLTVAAFWLAVARLGGYLARTRDGPPGWRSLWRGWLYVQTLLEGAHLATHLRL